MAGDVEDKQVTPDADAYDPYNRGIGNSQNLEDLENDSAGGFYNPGGDAINDAKSVGGSDLGKLENKSVDKSGAAPASADEINTGGASDTVGKGFRAGVSKGKRRISGARGFIKKHRLALIAAGTPVGAIIIGLALLIIFVGSLKIPNLAQHIESYQFSRITRQFARSAERTTGEELGTAAAKGANKSVLKGLQEKYANATGRVKNTWKKLDDYRPTKVAEKLGSGDTGLKLNFKGDVFTGADINGEHIALSQLGKSKFVPGLKNLLEFKNNVQFSQDFAPALETSLRATEVGPIMRGLVARQVRQKLGIGLVAWTVGKYQGKKLADAERTQVQEQAAAIDDGDPKATTGVTGTLNDEENDAAAAEKKALSTSEGVDDIIKNKGFATSVKESIGKTLAKTPLQDVLNFANPAAAAVPLCIVYDGSMSDAQPVIDNATRQQQAAFFYVASAADQQKQGSADNANDASGDGLATAADASNTLLGDITQSNAEIRAGNGTVNTTDSGVSAEASAGGEFTLLNATGIPQSAASVINSLADNVCPGITNVYVQGILAGLNVLASLIPGEGEADAALTDAANEVTTTIINKEATSLADTLLGKLITKTVSEKATEKVGGAATKAVVLKNIVLDGITSTAKIVGITLFAKLIVASRAEQLSSGTAQGTDLANEADDGGNIQAGELERTQLFGRPMLKTEVCASNQDDVAFRSQQESQQSAYQRYVSPSNADSLMSKTALDISANLNTSFPRTILHIVGDLLQPLKFMGTLGDMLMGKASALSLCQDADAGNYGNVQFGWSDQEENLIDSNDSYLPLENQKTLDDAPVQDKDYPTLEDEIASKYSKCFGYDYDSSGDGEIDPTDKNGDLKLMIAPGEDGSLGSLLQGKDSADIMRDAHGNVLDQGLCSPTNLGPNNPQYGQMVFRWRLAMQYDTTLDQLNDEQSAP